MYGLTNLDEFVAEAFTSREFQAALRGIQVKSGSAWDRFVSLVRQLLGLSERVETALGEALKFGAQLMQDNVDLTQAGGLPLFAQKQADPATQTPAFRKWFGGSKVVDAEGKPLVVYHGTHSDVQSFAGGKVKARFPHSEGFYFTSSPFHASVYADSINNAAEKFNPTSPFAKPAVEGGNVIPAYVSLQNPKLITVSEWGTLESAVDGDGGARVRAARAEGHDGVIVTRKAGDEYDGQLVIAFRPEQIKSATGNRGTFDAGSSNIMFSQQGLNNPRDAADKLVSAITVDNVRKHLDHKFTDYRTLALGALGRRQIADLYTRDIPQLSAYSRMVQQMDAEKNDEGAQADEVAREWGGLKDDKALADLMHDSTLAQIDPSKEFVDGDSKPEYARLRMKWEALTPEAKSIYTRARDMYEEHYAKVREAIRDRIERAELSQERRAEMMARMDGEFFDRIKGVYFPLARFGQYVVVARNAEGESVAVSRAETMAEAEAERANMKSRFPADQGFKVGKVIKAADFNAARDGVEIFFQVYGESHRCTIAPAVPMSRRAPGTASRPR